MKKFLNNNLKNFVNTIFNRVKDDSDYESPFFLIEIIQRRKDNPDLDCSYRTIRWFTVYSIEDFDKIIAPGSEMIEFCNRHNARAYLHVNIKDSKAVLSNMLGLISKYTNFNNRTLNKLEDCFYHAARMQEANIKGDNMFWVVDFDYENHYPKTEDSSILDEKIEQGTSGAFYEDGFIANVRKQFLDFATQFYSQEKKDMMNSDCFSMKNVHGFHLIIPPFDLFREIRMGMHKHLINTVPGFIDIVKDEARFTDRVKKNNCTILYMP